MEDRHFKQDKPAKQDKRAALDKRAEQDKRVGQDKCAEQDKRAAQDKHYMKLAILQAQQAEKKGEVPIGAVVVYDPIDPATRKHVLPKPQLIAAQANTREQESNPAGHAEFSALLRASKYLKTWRLTGCTVYVTLEPCLMCAGLMLQSRIDRCVYGAADPKAGALGSLYALHSDKRLNHNFEVTSGVLERECATMLTGFFAKKRSKIK